MILHLIKLEFIVIKNWIIKFLDMFPFMDIPVQNIQYF